MSDHNLKVVPVDRRAPLKPSEIVKADDAKLGDVSIGFKCSKEFQETFDGLAEMEYRNRSELLKKLATDYVSKQKRMHHYLSNLFGAATSTTDTADTSDTEYPDDLGRGGLGE